MNEQATAVRDLLAQVDHELIAERVSAIRDLINAGEEGVALEILVDNVIDEDLTVSEDFRDVALRLATRMHLGGNRWDYLRSHVKIRPPK